MEEEKSITEIEERINRKKHIFLFIVAALLVIIPITISVTTQLAFKEETYSFENVPFEWDDDFDRYDVCIKEEDTDPYGDYKPGYITQFHYYVDSSKAHLIYSDETWACFGEIKSSFNAFGKRIFHGITSFYINVNYVAEDNE